MYLWKITGIIAACLTSFAFIPQVLKMYKTKSARDISGGTLYQLVCGAALWMVYGIALGDAIIIIANLITLCSLLVALVLYFQYRSKAPQSRRP